MNHSEFEYEARRARDLLCERYGLPDIPFSIRWDLKGESALGMALGHTVVRLHPEAARLLGSEYVSTVRHEVAHIVTEYRRRKAGIGEWDKPRWSAHGLEWKRAMIALGESPDRTCRLPDGVTLTPARKVRKFRVECSCRTHVVSAVRANRLTRYKCTVCGSGLRLIGEVPA